MGFASRICCSIQECFPLMAARYCRISLVLSVFPAPDSPLITMHWSCLEGEFKGTIYKVVHLVLFMRL